MKMTRPTLASMTNFGAGTVSNLFAGLCATSLGLAFAIRQNAILALSIFGIAGVLWLIGWAHLKTKPDSSARESVVTDVKYSRRFIVPSIRARRILQGFSLVLVGIGTTVLVVSAVLGLQKTQSERDSERDAIKRIDESTSVSRDKIAGIKEQLTSIVDDYIFRLREEEAKSASLESQLRLVEGERDELRERVTSALEAKARTELAAGKSVDEVLAEMRSGSPYDLLEFLNNAVEIDMAGFEAQRETLILRHRERAEIAYRLGEIDRAEDSLSVILEIAPNDIEAVNRIGLNEVHRGHSNAAVERFEQVLELAETSQWEAIAHQNIGYVMARIGNLVESERHLVKSLELFEQSHVQRGVASILINLGSVARIRRDYTLAFQYYDDALSICQELQDDAGIALANAGLGTVEYARLNNEAAEQYTLKAIDYYRATISQAMLCDSLNVLGLIYRGRGEFNESNKCFDEALVTASAINYVEGVGNTLANIAFNKWIAGDLVSSRDYYLRALEVAQEIGSIEMQATQLAGLGRVEAYLQHYEAARERWSQSVELYRELGVESMADMVQSWLEALPHE